MVGRGEATRGLSDENPSFTLGSNEPYIGGVVLDAWGWVMDAYGTARLAAKDAGSAIVARICEDFNMTPVLARAHFEQMARYFSDFGHMALQPGELCYLVVASEEPPGKPIIACRKVQVSLELVTPEDHGVLRGE